MYPSKTESEVFNQVFGSIVEGFKNNKEEEATVEKEKTGDVLTLVYE